MVCVLSCALAGALAIPSLIFLGVFAKKVSFVVDMTGQTVSSNGVHIAGNFQGWNPASTRMSNLYTSNKIYE